MNELKKVFIVMHDWDDMKPPSWSIHSIYASRELAKSKIDALPKLASETRFEPLIYKIEEHGVIES